MCAALVLLAPLLTTAATPAPPPPPPSLGCGNGTCDTLRQWGSLWVGEVLTSRTLDTNVPLTLVMQGDGNLVLYRGKMHPSHTLWASGTSEKVDWLRAVRAMMQSDGNLVLYTSIPQPVWATNTNGMGWPPYRLDLVVNATTGALVIHAGSGYGIWYTGQGKFSCKGKADGQGDGQGQADVFGSLETTFIITLSVICAVGAYLRFRRRSGQRPPPRADRGAMVNDRAQQPHLNEVLLGEADGGARVNHREPERDYHIQGREETWLGEQEHPSKSVGAAYCAICMEALWRARVGVLTNNAGRVCRHLMHYRCGTAAMKGREKLCPLCRAEGSEVVRVPRPEEDPLQWFRLMDVNGEFSLTKQEVIDALRAQMDVDEDVLSDAVTHAWAGWTSAGGEGVIRAAELPLLLEFLRDDRFASAEHAPTTPPPGGVTSPFPEVATAT
eukprot:Hpha_TRINITY_DN15255_c0_g1::TRINITY_DN15255_c0_g1_i1::g.66103::m.66103